MMKKICILLGILLFISIIPMETDYDYIQNEEADSDSNDDLVNNLNYKQQELTILVNRMSLTTEPDKKSALKNQHEQKSQEFILLLEQYIQKRRS